LQTRSRDNILKIIYMTTKPKTNNKFKQTKSATQMGSIEKMYGKDIGIKTLKNDREIREHYKGKEYKALREFIMGHE